MNSMEPGQLALLDVFARVCASISSEDAQNAAKHAVEVDAPSLSNYLETLQNKANLVDELKLQNEKLQTELATAVKELADKRKGEETKRLMATNMSRPQTPLSSLGVPNMSEQSNRGISPLLDDLDSLDFSNPVVAKSVKNKYRKLKKQRNDTKDAMDKAVISWRYEKQVREHWEKLATTLQERLDHLAEGPTQTTHSKSVVRSDDETNTMPSSPPIMPVVREPPELPVLVPDHNLVVTTNSTTIQRNSDSTESGSDRPVERDVDTTHTAVPVFIKEESPDLPIVISSHAVKKRHTTRNEPDLEAHLTAKVKNETLSSSPAMGVARLNKLITHESMDLDDAGPVGITPKKSRFTDPRAKTIARLQRSKTSFVDENTTPSKGLEYHTALKAIDDSEAQHAASTTRPGRQRLPLKPRDPNRDHLPRITTAPAASRKRRRADDAEKGAEIFGEDGESPTRKRNTKAIDFPDAVRNRLDSLLQGPSPQKAVLQPARSYEMVTLKPSSVNRVATSENHGSLSDSEAHPRPVPRHSTKHLSENELTKKARSSIKAIGGANRSETPNNDRRHTLAGLDTARRGSKSKEEMLDLEAIDPDHEPFRARPLSRLSLEHFKINPAYNGGADYAYTSVVRGKKQRRCLEGCTKPECCGDKFRKLVEMMAENAGEATLSQEERDQLLLEDYLGDNKGRLLNIPRAERAELLLQAKTRKLAMENSKHRNAYAKRPTPPGYWDADFPDTQQHEANRKAGYQQERDLIEERYHDAMRTGGKWLFRDE